MGWRSAGGMGDWNAPVLGHSCPSCLPRLSITCVGWYVSVSAVADKPRGTSPHGPGIAPHAPLEHLGCATQRKIESGAPVVRQGKNDYFRRPIVQFDLAALVHPAARPVHVRKLHFEAGDPCGEAAKGKPCAFNGQLAQLVGLMVAGLKIICTTSSPFGVNDGPTIDRQQITKK